MTKAIRWTEDQLAEHMRRLRPATSADKLPEQPAKKAPKYRNKKVEQDGEQFDSRKEARRWVELQMMRAEGSIANLRRQVSYELIPKQRRADGEVERACAYVADFVYEQDGMIVVEDAKGMRTRDYIIKRKLMLHVHGVSIVEV